MKKQIWTVRIIVHHDFKSAEDYNASRDAAWLGEFLRYAGLSRKLAESKTTDEGYCEVFELYPPIHGSGSVVWAKQNAARLCSFGLDAAAAPKWDSFEPITA